MGLTERVTGYAERVRARSSWPFFAEISPLVAGAVAMVVAIEVAPERAPESFYAAASGVIPVLLLTLALELRLLGLAGTGRRPTPDQGDRVLRALYSVLVLFILVYGEMSALYALAQNDFKNAQPGVIFGAIALGLVAIAVAASRQGTNTD